MIERGQALTLIDPHGDLARLVLAQLVARGHFHDERAFDRLLYLDLPAAERQNLFLPFNVLRQPLPPHSLAANIKEAFHRAWPALSGGAAPMFDALVQDGVKVLISNDLPLTTLYRLLTDKTFRDGLLQKETDPDVVRFFREQFDRLAPRDQAQQAGAALRRAHLLTFSPALRHSLGQSENRLDFRRIIDGNQTVIINLALGDAETRRLLGCLLTVGAEQGALSRMQLPPGERANTYHLICDEWIEFAAQSEEALSRMLSLTRKVGLFAVLAHQTWTQTSLRMRGALQNVGLEVAFRLGRPDAEYAASILGRIDPAAVKHRVADPAAAARGHPLFEPLSEQWERWVQAIQDLAPRQAFIRHSDGMVRKIRTLSTPDPSLSPRALEEVEAESLRRHFRPRMAGEQGVADQRGRPLRGRLPRWRDLNAG
ncbi:hypothetical protein BH23CHL2_BH23CHL2_19670 [soil metagenome]